MRSHPYRRAVVLASALALLTAGCGQAPPAQATPTLATSSILEFRLAFPDSGPDRVRHVFADSVMYVARTALLSDADLTSARQHDTGQDDLILRITFSPETGQRLASALERHIGGHLAVLIDGKVTAMPRIMSAIGAQGRVDVNTMLRGAEADRLLARVSRRWPNAALVP